MFRLTRRLVVVPRPAVSLARFYADKVVKVPGMGDSISEGTLKRWTKNVGDFVRQDEEVASIETDKVDVAVNAPESGKITKVFAAEEDTVAVGAELFAIDIDAAPAADTPKKEPAPSASASAPPAAPTTPATPQQPPKPAAAATKPAPVVTTAASSAPPSAAAANTPVIPVTHTSAAGNRQERHVKVNRMRARIAERMKESQNTNAALTTFNEIDMSRLIAMRNRHKDAVMDRHGVKLGFMSPFLVASARALQTVPVVNARFAGDTIVYNDYVDISVAVATPKGLVTPVLRNVETMSMVGVERSLAEVGARARAGALAIEDMQGGTFTISNGGVFGSLMGTPIINLPQSAILGMHAINQRPVVVEGGRIEARPMMYVALTYDHRLIDGREAVTFLVNMKKALEDPERLLLEL